MKHKVSELEGTLLDAAVANALGARAVEIKGGRAWAVLAEAAGVFEPSVSWAHGGPIIERERIDLWWADPIYGEPVWGAGWIARSSSLASAIRERNARYARTYEDGTGPTLLIAAMRAYVASKFGEEVELP